MVSPRTRFASSALIVSVFTDRATSFLASRIVFDPSRAMSRAKSSRLFRTSSAVLRRTCDLSPTVIFRVVSKPRRACPKAVSTSFLVAAGTVSTSEPS